MRLLFFNINHAGYLPLVQKLESEGFTFVVNRSTLRDEAERAGLPVHRFEDFQPQDSAEVSDREVVRILNTLAEALPFPRMQQAFGSPQGQFLTHTGQDFFLSLKQLITQDVTLILTLERWLTEHPIDLLIVASEGHRERSLLRYAQRKEIPTLLMDSLEAHWYSDHGRSSPLADHIATLGPITESVLRRKSPSASVLATGLPHLDSFVCHEQLRETSGPRVLVCPGYIDFGRVDFVTQAKNLASFHQTLLRCLGVLSSEAKLIVLPHSCELEDLKRNDSGFAPLESHYKKWAVKQGVRDVRFLRKSSPELLQTVDVVVTHGLRDIIPEALMSERPVIAVNLTEKQRAFFRNERVVKTVESRQSFSEALEAALNDERGDLSDSHERQQLISSYRGCATERVAELILRVTSEPGSGKGCRNTAPNIGDPVLTRLYELVGVVPQHP